MPAEPTAIQLYVQNCDTAYGNLFFFQEKNKVIISYSSQSAGLLVKHRGDAFKCHPQKKALYRYSDATWVPHGSRGLLTRICTYRCDAFLFFLKSMLVFLAC